MQDFKTKIVDFDKNNSSKLPSYEKGGKNMARKGENIYKRKDGRYEGRYIKSYDLQGKPHWGSVYGRTYAQTKEKLAEKKFESIKGRQFVSSDVQLKNWIDKWISEQSHIKQTTKMMYYSHLKNHIESNIGSIQLKKLNADILQRFVDSESNRYSPKTVHAVFSMLKLSLKSAKEKGYVQNIYSDITLPKVKRKILRVLSKQEQKQLEKTISESDNQYDLGILLCLYTGIRIGELCALKWENIDLKNATITILHTAERVLNDDKTNKAKTKIFIDDPKSDTSIRIIPIPKFLVGILKRYKRNDGYILRDNGVYTDSRNISRRFKKLLQEAGLPDFNYHILRHTFATRALELGMDIKTLSEILGHANVTITLNLYAHSLPEHKKKQMDKFNTLYQNPSK